MLAGDNQSLKSAGEARSALFISTYLRIANRIFTGRLEGNYCKQPNLGSDHAKEAPVSIHISYI